MELLTFSLEPKPGLAAGFMIDLPINANADRNEVLQASLDETNAKLDSMKGTAGYSMMVDRSKFRKERESRPTAE